MKRRTFLKKSSFAAAYFLVQPPSNFFLENEFSRNELIGKGNPKLLGKDYKLREEVYTQFEKMKKEAKEEGFSIYVVSSYRNYAHQNRIWERKYKNFRSKGFSHLKTIEKIIEYSTIPGTSRHHWGTDLDIIDATKGIPNNPLSEVHFNKGGRMYNFKLWLNENAEKFGFYEVYTNQKGRKGFYYEPWHFSYKPTSLKMLQEFKEINLKELLETNKLMGSEHFTPEFIESYKAENILDINPDLLK